MAAAAAAGPDSPVPTCPDWLVRDLVRHQGGVHRWATGYLTGPRAEFWDASMDEVVGAWPADAELLDWFSAGHQSLLTALSSADPDLVCFTFLRAPSPLAMWARRQAHETTIHRVDAQAAAGWPSSPVPAEFAADGVDELLTCFITRPGGSLRADPARRLRISCTDTAGDWLVSVTPDGASTSCDDPGPADCRVSGTAHDLYLTLWNRLADAPLAVQGDRSVLQLFTDRVKVRWS